MMENLVSLLEKKIPDFRRKRASPEGAYADVDAACEVICAIDRRGRFLHVSSDSQGLWGYAPAEMIGRNFLEWVHPDDQRATAGVAEALQNGTAVSVFENRYIKKDGSILCVRWSISWCKEQDIFYCVAREAANATKAQKQKDVQERRLKRVYKLAGLAWWEYNIEAETYTTSDEIFYLYGTSVRENKQTSLSEFLACVNPEDTGKLTYDLAALSEDTCIHYEHRVVRPSGEVIYLQHYIEIVRDENGTPVALHGLAKNITDEKQKEAALKLANERYELASRATSDAVWDWDLVAGSCYFNEAFTALFGHENATDHVHKNWAENIYPDDSEGVLASLTSALENASVSQWQGEYRFYRKDQALAYVLDRGYIIRDESGKAVRMVGSMQDVTAMKKVSEELRKLSLIVKESPNAVVVTDKDERITWVNQAFTDISGYGFDEVIGKKPSAFLQGKNTSPKIRAYLRERIRTAAPFQCEMINYTKSGREYWIEIKGQPVFNGKGELEQFFAVQTDITERIELQRMVVEEKIDAEREITKAMIQAQEKERNEIGKELHDNINQLLATIKLYIESIRLCPEQRERLIDKGIELANRAMHESRSLAHRLVTPLDAEGSFRAAIEDLLSHYELLGVFSVSLRFTLCEDKLGAAFRLTIYRILQECLTNVVKYARATKVEVCLRCDDDLLKVIVKDNGIGFQAKSKSPGIGFTNIKNRASLFKGVLQVQSESGSGCTVAVSFPTVNDQIIGDA